MITQHLNDAYYAHVISWAERVAEPLIQNNGWPMCPYARRALVNKSIKVWSITDYQELEIIVQSFEFKPWAVEVVLCNSSQFIDEWASKINHSQSKLTALADDPQHPGDIAGQNPSNQLYPLIILQDRHDLMTKRHSLAQTDYYSTWADWYKSYVLG